MPPERAWTQNTVYIPETKTLEKQPYTLDAAAVAAALGPRLPSCEPCKRNENDRNTIWILSVGVGVLAVSCVLCALISALMLASSSRIISKLHTILK